MTWQSSQLPAIATQCQLFKTGSDFGGKQAFRSGTCGTAAGPDQPPSPPLLHKPDIVSRFAKWRRQSQYRGWVIEMAIAERLLSVQVLTPTPDEGSCWRGLWHVCDSSLLQLVWHTNYCGPTWFFVAATLPYCCSSIWMMCAVWTMNCPLKKASNSGDWLHCWQNILRDPSLTTTLC